MVPTAQAPGAERLQYIGSPAWLRSHEQPDTSATTAEPAAQQVPNAGDPLGPASLGRTALGLVAVIALIFICSALLKRFGPYKRFAGQSLKIVAGQSVGPRERVVVVEVDDTWLVLGVAQNGVNTLHKLPAKREHAPTGAPGPARGAAPTFGEAFSENLRRATSRFPGRR